MNGIKIKWGMGAVTIITDSQDISIEYWDLIKSFLRVDIETRRHIGNSVVAFFGVKK